MTEVKVKTSNTLLLGIDIGTTGVKTVLINERGEVVAGGWAEVNLYSPQPGWAEENPDEWWKATREAVRKCLAQPDIKPMRLAGVGVSGMAPALVLLDSDLRPVRRSMQQNDARAGNEIEDLKQMIDLDALFKETGGMINQQTLAPKLLWICRHEPDNYRSIAHVMGSYDYINYCLTGELALEQNWALESGLFSLEKRSWIPWMLEAAGVKAQWLAPVRQAPDWMGRVTEAAAELTGIPVGTPVCAGSADHIASALSAGITEAGDLLLKFGGAGDILFALDYALTDPRLFIDYHDIPDRFLLNGCMAASGSVVKWFVQNLGGQAQREAESNGTDVYSYLDRLAAKIAPGAEGLVVLPYFLGEKTPIFDVNARGVFAGLGLHHTTSHIYRAILESVIYGFQHHIEVMGELGCVPKRVVATNGGAKSPLWRSIAADVIGLPVSYIQDHPGSSLGAAFIAGIASQCFSGWNEIRKFVKVSDVTEPVAARHQIYREYYQLYRELYQNLHGKFFTSLTGLGLRM
jgi:xylulokinase